MASPIVAQGPIQKTVFGNEYETTSIPKVGNYSFTNPTPFIGNLSWDLIGEISSGETIGIGKACELIFTASMIGAQEAKEIGLVNHVIPGDELMKSTYEMAKSIASRHH